MGDSGEPILYHETKSIPWVLSRVHVNTMSPCQYHESISIQQHDYRGRRSVTKEDEMAKFFETFGF